MEKGRWGMARVGVLTVIDEEYDAVAQALDTNHHLSGTPYYLADADDFRIAVRQIASRSQVPATHAARAMLEDLRPELAETP